ncbi:1,4-dihydroxy-2-naphthoate octaprenyltransferase [Dictyobacter aurantiacus]|uniref:1,4-dihydroxy-2-naphthoate octaprenyltransferase n=1 Tax=Dictyobacter aurantiacus TaxID=1936993 RepID=A0A401ZDT6_9CHLR|nr:1,4-dihydroxy-2-naphthoate octaprenyltransferase [Dictyobacter aurantiacus]GCE05044.1 hypothetical protein KDAU_23730 [Dictyobacter aurantiacus]
MENTEQNTTHQDLAPEVEPQEEASTQTPHAIQVVDADPRREETAQIETHEDQAETIEDESTVAEDEPEAVTDESEIAEDKPEAVEDDIKPEVVPEVKPTKKQQSAQVVTADRVQAEEVPTIPIGSLQTISTLEPEVSVHSVASMRAVGMPAPLVVQPSEYRRGISEWLDIWRDGIRLNYLPLSLMPILLGTALAWTQSVTPDKPLGQLDIVHFVMALVAAAILQIGANLINDYYDHQHGIDASNALGPGGLIQQGLIKPIRILTIGLIVLGIGAVLGLIAALAGGPLTCLFGLIIVLCAYFFSATKKSLSSLGLGELVGFIAFGLLPVMGAYMIQTGGHLVTTIFYYSLALGFLAAAIVYANNMRDIEGDSHVGRKTLVTMIGLRGSRIAYIVLMVLAYLVVILLGVPHGHNHFVLLALWTLPTLAVAISGVLRTEISAGFHDVMRQSMKIFIMFTILLIVGLVIAAFIPVIPKLPAHLISLP